MSQTSRYANYVIPPRMALEKAGATQILDLVILNYPTGPRDGYAHHTPAMVAPPPGSDLVDEWEFFYEVARRMGLEMSVPHLLQMLDPIPLDMTVRPTDEDILDIVCAGSRIPLDDLRGHEHGLPTPEPPVIVAARNPDSAARLDVGNAEMMEDLGNLVRTLGGPRDDPDSFMLLSRREMHVINSVYNTMKARNKRAHNPAYMNPADMGRLGLNSGDLVTIRSDRAEVIGIVDADATVRTGVVSMSHAFGLPDVTSDPHEVGTSTSVLSDVERDYDRYKRS